MSSEIVPFGKHKGKPIEALLDDREYLDWLLSQAWFQQRYGNIYQIVINNGQEPSETPEHNAMQVRFLDRDFRLRFAHLTLDEVLIELMDVREPKFEVEGVDAAFDVYARFKKHFDHGSYFARSGEAVKTLKVEIKPVVGDDYPAVLRQMRRNRAEYLLIRSYTGVGVTQEQFIQFFESQGITVVFESDVDAVQLPPDSKNIQ